MPRRGREAHVCIQSECTLCSIAVCVFKHLQSSFVFVGRHRRHGHDLVTFYRLAHLYNPSIWHRARTPETCAQPVFALATLHDGVFRIAIGDAALVLLFLRRHIENILP